MPLRKPPTQPDGPNLRSVEASAANTPRVRPRLVASEVAVVEESVCTCVRLVSQREWRNLLFDLCYRGQAAGQKVLCVVFPGSIEIWSDVLFCFSRRIRLEGPINSARRRLVCSDSRRLNISTAQSQMAKHSFHTKLGGTYVRPESTCIKYIYVSDRRPDPGRRPAAPFLRLD